MALVLALVLAGCLGDSDTPDSSCTFTEDCECPEGTTRQGYGCAPVQSWKINVDATAAMVVDLPYPHGDQCLSATDWQDATFTSSTAKFSIVSSSAGEIQGDWVRLIFDKAGAASLLLKTDDKPICNTFRYDPWSIEPDPSDGNLTVAAINGTGSFSVRYTRFDGAGCATKLDATGQLPPSGWRTVALKSSPAGCV